MKEAYREKSIHKEVLKPRSQSRETLSNKEKLQRNDDRVTFNITNNIIIFLKELHISLAPDEQHRKVFTDIRRIGFEDGKSLKDHLHLKVSFT